MSNNTKKTNFEAWHHEADMPELVDGKWVDLEDGIAYDPGYNYTTFESYRRTALSDRALASRDIAKRFGGKALRGTKKQKEWAETIRSEKLKQMSEEYATLACRPEGLLNHSKFWIENRDVVAAEIGEFAHKQNELASQYDVAMKNYDTPAVASIAAEYNALTKQWGFE